MLKRVPVSPPPPNTFLICSSGSQLPGEYENPEKSATSVPFVPWADALTNVNALENLQCGLTDGSSAGDWRLPNVRELQSLIDYNNYDPALPSGHPFTNEQSGPYWSSTSVNFSLNFAWLAYVFDGIIHHTIKSFHNYVLAVRGGQ